MAEGEGTPEEFADMAAALRGGGSAAVPASKTEDHRRIVEALHPEQKESEQADGLNVEAQLTQRVKPSHAALIRALHPDKDDGRAVS